jgi:hypothetical protein
MMSENTCCIVINFTLLFIFFIIGIVLLFEYIKYISVIEKECILTNVIYPTRLPHNVSDMSGFKTCDCGKRCISDLGICISVYGNIIDSNNTMMFIDNVNDDYTQCTYQENNCPDGENIANRLNAINEAKDIANQYIEMMNTTVKCYIDTSTNELYFNNEFNEVGMYIVFGFLFFFIFALICLYRGSKPKEMTTIQLNEISFRKNTEYNNSH